MELFDTIIDMDDATMFGEEGSSTLKSFILKALSKPTNGAQGQPPISGNNEGRNDYLNQYLPLNPEFKTDQQLRDEQYLREHMEYFDVRNSNDGIVRDGRVEMRNILGTIDSTNRNVQNTEPASRVLNQVSNSEQFKEDEDMIKCESCEYTTSHRGNLTEHIKEIHSKDKHLKCNQCEYTTSVRDTLVEHVKVTHGPSTKKKKKCPDCDYKS